MSVQQAAPTAVHSATASNGVVLYPINAGNESYLKSLNSSFPTQVTFVNLRSTPIQLWWLNHAGNRVSYGTVQPNNSLVMNTYETHPWVIIDDSSKAVLGIWLSVTEKGLILVF